MYRSGSVNLAVMVLFALLPAVAGARTAAGAAAAARSDLSVERLRGVPAAVVPGDTVIVRGRVLLRRAPVRRIRLVGALRGNGQGQAIGSRLLRGVAPRKPRRFRLRLTIPFRGLGAGTYRLVVCARSSRARDRCATRRLEVRPSAGAPGTSGPPTPSPGPSPTPTAAGTTTATATPTSAPGLFSPGSETLGDRLFPKLGNGGYDVQSYDLALTYTPAVHHLSGTATISALATQGLSRVSFDLQGFAVSSVTVDGVPATFTRSESKLRVTTAAGIPIGSTFTVAVTYAGTPPAITDPDGSSEGFLRTPDGAFVVGEPMGSMGWFPNNNHPSDKAPFRVAMTVPGALEVVGNGTLESASPPGPTRTWVWQETHPMATYLATATIGDFVVSEKTVAGLDYYDAVDPAEAASSAAAGGVALEPAAIALFQARYGQYPFSITGSIVDSAPAVGYALETQTKPIYPLGIAASPGTVSHELAHQWYGDSLSPQRWEDIWLNEGFAEFSSWLFDEQTGGETTKQRYDAFYAANPAGDGFWRVPPAAPPTAADLFDTDAMYNRGAMTLEALRQIVGDVVFYDILKTWAADHKYGTVMTPEFIALVKVTSGKDPARLDQFFRDWLYDADRPTITPAGFGP